ncbi:MAG: hypothetical protein ACXW07_10700 [Nitrososphaeraceae archaeon]
MVLSSSSSYSELREDINNIIKEWHFGTEDVFEDKDLEEMTSDIMRVVNEKRPPIENQQVKKKRTRASNKQTN